MNASTQNPSPEPAALDMVIFGGAGDLSCRKLLPALYQAHQHQTLPEDTRIVAIGRQANWSQQDYLNFVETHSRPFIDPKHWHAPTWQTFLKRMHYIAMDISQAQDYAHLHAALPAARQRVFYLATAPQLFVQICQQLRQQQLIEPHSRVVLEKPLGTDLASAQHINREVARCFAEQQVYRIDHYLGKETVQNLMVLRFGNAIFEPLWRAPFIKSVQITVAETVGVGSRAGFYDGTGALRDMVQNHLLQLLCFVAMEPPISLNADDVRDEKLKVLRSLKKMSPSEVKKDTVRGQYGAGAIEGQTVKGYLEEVQVPADSRTETFVALRAQLQNARWAKVPFFLRTGKRMPTRCSEIIIEFADQAFSIFGHPTQEAPNRLIIRLQPEESIQLQMMVKEPGSGMSMQPVKLGLDLLQSSDKRRPEAYERLLVDVIKGRLTHFMRHDELEAAWQWVEPLQTAWAALDEKPKPYAAGTWGPAASSALIARDNLSWFEES